MNPRDHKHRDSSLDFVDAYIFVMWMAIGFLLAMYIGVAGDFICGL